MAQSKESKSSKASVDAVADVTELALLDVAALRADAVENAMETVARLRAWTDATEARLVARADRLASKGRGAGGRETARSNGRRTGADASRVADRAGTLEAKPDLADALEFGETSAAHVDALTRQAKDLPEEARRELFDDDEITRDACRLPADTFAKLVRNKADKLRRTADPDPPARLSKWVRASDGRHIINGDFDAATGAKVFAAIDAEVESLAQTQSLPKNDTTAATALVELTHRGLGAGPNDTPAEVLVIDAATLTDGPHDHTVSETSSGAPVHPDTIQRAMCHAIVLPTVISTTTGTVLDIGRRARVANRAQRRALRAMYPSCAFPGCSVAFDHCQMHHLTPWQEGGRTDMANLLPLCSRHHHLAHEGRWRFSLDLDRTLHIHQPDGRLFQTVALPSATLAAALAVWPKPEHPPCATADAQRDTRRRTNHNRAA